MNTQNTHEKLAELHAEIFGRKDTKGNVVAGGLVHATSAMGWDKDDPGTEQLAAPTADLGAKPIPMREWLRAFIIAGSIAKAMPQLEKPAPGADPEGFVWLTYRQIPNSIFALEIRKDEYVWTQRGIGSDPRKFSSPTLEDVVHAMNATFRRLVAVA